MALIGSIAYFYQQEWSQMEVLEDETKRIHILREEQLNHPKQKYRLTEKGKALLK